MIQINREQLVPYRKGRHTEIAVQRGDEQHRSNCDVMKENGIGEPSNRHNTAVEIRRAQVEWPRLQVPSRIERRPLFEVERE